MLVPYVLHDGVASETFWCCAASVREALEHAKSVEDMLPLIKAIFDELGTKAERSLFDGEHGHTVS
jgi:hypothetical protein